MCLVNQFLLLIRKKRSNSVVVSMSALPGRLVLLCHVFVPYDGFNRWIVYCAILPYLPRFPTFCLLFWVLRCHVGVKRCFEASTPPHEFTLLYVEQLSIGYDFLCKVNKHNMFMLLLSKVKNRGQFFFPCIVQSVPTGKE